LIYVDKGWWICWALNSTVVGFGGVMSRGTSMTHGLALYARRCYAHFDSGYVHLDFLENLDLPCEAVVL
jgi:hypothetical protein